MSVRRKVAGNIAFGILGLWTLVAGSSAARGYYASRQRSAPFVAKPIENAKSLATGRLQTGGDSTPVVVVFTDFRCGTCVRLSVRLDSLVAEFPNIKLIERLYPTTRLNSAASASAIMCAHGFGAFAEMRHLFDVGKADIEDGAWGILGKRAGIPDTAAFVRCVTDRRYASDLHDDSIAVSGLGLMGPPAIVINDSIFQLPLELDELRVRLAPHRKAPTR